MPARKPYIVALAGNPELQDRIATFSANDHLIIATADGAGGLSGGAQAAEAFIELVALKQNSLLQPDECKHILQQADREISNDPACGETTAIILVVEKNRIFGASVGDSEAWLFGAAEKTHLTKSQKRKPFLGSGAAVPAAFDFPASRGILIVATDGLWKYTSLEKIFQETQIGEASTLPDRLVNLVRLRSGALQDDIAVAALPLEQFLSALPRNQRLPR